MRLLHRPHESLAVLLPPPHCEDVFTSRLQLARGARVRSLELSAPGWLPAAQVLDTALAHAVADDGGGPRTTTETAPLTATPDPPVQRRRPQASRTDAHTQETWAQRCLRLPECASVQGLPLLPRSTRAAEGTGLLEVAAGPESGFCVEVPHGEWTLGRGDGHDLSLGDPYLSRRGLPLRHGPRGLTVGERRAQDAPTGAADRSPDPQGVAPRPALSAGATVFLDRNRADLPSLDATPRMSEHLVDWPVMRQVSPARPPSWALYAVPLAIGVVLVLVTGMWWFMLFSLAGPLTAVLGLRTEKRRVRRETEEARAQLRQETERVVVDLAAAVGTFRAQLSAQGPAAGAGIVVGRGTCVSPVGVRLPRAQQEADAVAAQLPPHVRLDGTAHLLCDDVPLVVPVCSRIEVSGLPESVHGVLRALLSELADAEVRLPHVPSLPETSGLTALSDAVPGAGALTAETGAGAAGTAPGNPAFVSGGAERRGGTRPVRMGSAGTTPVSGRAEATIRTETCADGRVLAVLNTDAGTPAHRRGSHAGTLSDRPLVVLRDRGDDGYGEMLLPAPAELRALSGGLWAVCGAPLSGRTAIHSHSAATHVRLLRTRLARGPQLGAAQTPAGEATTTELLRLDGAMHRGPSGERPGGLSPVPLGTALGPPSAAGPHGPGPPFPSGGAISGGLGDLGDAAAGPETSGRQWLVHPDLLRHGPHALVAGTTGSGKSVLLQSWLELLCRRHSPQQLRLVLLDFKGGAGLSRFAEDPHTDALVTDLDEASALRAVRSIGAEVKRRERLLAAAEAHDIEEYCARRDSQERASPEAGAQGGRRTAGGEEEGVDGLPLMPRLLIVVDEFHVLAALSTTVLTQLERLTALGRSLGIHLLLATQRPAGVVTAQMRTNIALRICLRVRDEADSLDVVGVPDAARIPPDQPGRALLSYGEGVQAFRCGLPEPAVPAEGEAAGEALPEVRVRDLRTDRVTIAPLTPASAPQRPSASPSGAFPPGPLHRVIAPALPERFVPGVPHAVALLDLPDFNDQRTWQAGEETGTVLLTGGRGGGWTTAAEVLTRAFRLAGEDVVHLAAAAASPEVDAARILRTGFSAGWFLEFLLRELEQEPRRCRIVVDDWEELQRAHRGSDRTERLERLLTGGFGIRAVVTGSRRLLAQRIGQEARTRVVFPPHSEQDAVYYGLRPDRFAGAWPPGRAVVLGEAAAEAGRAGADAQFALPVPMETTEAEATREIAKADAAESPEAGAPDPAEPFSSVHRPSPCGPHPFWTGFRAVSAVPRFGTQREPAEPPAPHAASSGPGAAGPLPDVSVQVGTDPLGRPVVWHPGRHGGILLVRVPQERLVPEELHAVLSAHRVPLLTQPDEPSDREQLETAAAGGPPVCLVLPAQRTHRPTPFDRTNDHGPTLLLGEWRESDMRGLGLRDLPCIPVEADAHWWLTDDGAVPVRIRNA
ncbi:FtsK/SpoIIIE domain-containing protein [Brevibacterium salitolerans]|uniref:FtsK/SpoIIIE domain-containing protein n=1 Tax=Brevibacterium salitolerans TaxID=1403566 RepID=UPI0031D51D6C